MDDETLFSCVSAFSGNGNTRDTTVHSKEALENIPEVHDLMMLGAEVMAQMVLLHPWRDQCSGSRACTPA